MRASSARKLRSSCPISWTARPRRTARGSRTSPRTPAEPKPMRPISATARSRAFASIWAAGHPSRSHPSASRSPGRPRRSHRTPRSATSTSRAWWRRVRDVPASTTPHPTSPSSWPSATRSCARCASSRNEAVLRQPLAEERLHALPRVLGGLLLVGGALIAEESVVRARVHDHLVIDAGLRERRADRADLVGRNERVLLAEQTEDLALDLRGARDRRELV